MTITSDGRAALAESIVAEAHAHGGLAPLDLERFWAENDAAERDPFGAAVVPVGLWSLGDAVFDELGIAEDFHRYEHDRAWRGEVNRAYNDRAERVIGRRVLDERVPDPALAYPPVKMLHDLFEARNVWHEQSWWLMPAASTEAELAALLDRVDARLADLRRFVLPAGWEEAKARLTARGVRPPRYRWQRGPVTFATSIYGAENLLFLLLDHERLAVRLRDTNLRAMLGLAAVLDAEHGDTPATAPRGFGFADDNCALLNPVMYELFGYPILEGVWRVYAPDARDRRYQHSDSAMGHLLPLLGKLDLTGTNFGPTLSVREIRQHLPHAVIEGQLAPFTLSRNEEVAIVAQTLRDIGQARATGRGLRLATAGSINNGTRLTGLRLVMATAQRFGRY